MTTTDETTAARAFYPSDWARFARDLRRAMHVQCSPGTPASPEKQAAVAALAGYVSEVFAADAPEGAFSQEKFLASCMVQGEAGTGNVLLDSPPDDDEAGEE